MKVCYFGVYHRTYSRSRVLLEGFDANGVRIVECGVDPKNRGLRKYWALYLAYRKIRREKFDFVLVAFPGHTIVWLAKLLFGVPVVFDAFVSLYDSNVYDRRVYGAKNPRAWLDWMKDCISMHLSDATLMDTHEHARYCAETFHIDPKKIVRVFVSTNDSIFFPRETKLPEICTVHFHGTFIPLQGVSYIVDAAALLKDEPIRFRILGRGQEYASIAERVEREHLSNIELVNSVPLDGLPGYIATAHFCLGIFGDTPKAGRVIPNKVYEYMAMGKAIITADTPAIREFNEFGPLPLDAVKGADPKALASAILALSRDSALQKRLGEGARALYLAHLQPKQIVKDMLGELSPIILQ